MPKPENALGREIRLLGAFNEKYANPEVLDGLSFSLLTGPDGQTQVVSNVGEVIFCAEAEKVVEFLAANQTNQLLMLVRNKGGRK